MVGPPSSYRAQGNPGCPELAVLVCRVSNCSSRHLPNTVPDFLLLKMDSILCRILSLLPLIFLDCFYFRYFSYSVLTSLVCHISYFVFTLLSNFSLVS